MQKKLKIIISLLILTFILSGCIKIRDTEIIQKDIGYNHTYQIDDNNELIDPEQDQDIDLWEDIKIILPIDVIEEYVVEFKIYTDGRNGELAYVEQIDYENDYWQISVDYKDTYNMKKEYSNEFYKTIIHEFFHVLSINNNQSTLDNCSDCKTFDDQEYYYQDSYVGLWIDEFWPTRDIQRISKNDGYWNKKIYRENKFVTEYASVDPTEDIAESFSFWVTDEYLESTEEGSIAYQKCVWFEQYPELVIYKNEINDGINEVLNKSN